MRKPEQFIMKAGVLNIGIAFVVFLYFTVGFVAYWKYGDDIKGSVFLNMPEKDAYVS